MQSERPRIGFIGAGRHSTANLYPAFAATGLPVAGIAERNPARASAAAARVNGQTIFKDHRALLEASSLDGVIVSLAPEHHVAVVADCVRAGVAIFVEKPLGSDASEAQQIADISADAGVPVMVGFMKRFAPAYKRLRSMIGEGAELGPVRSYACGFGFSPWKPDLSESEFVTQAVVHLIDLIRDLFGEVDAVSAARTASTGTLSIVATVRHANGIVGSLNFVYSSGWSQETEELSVTCENGVARVFDLTRIEVRDGNPPSGADVAGEGISERAVIFDVSNTIGSGALRDLYVRGFVGEMEHFIGVLHGVEQLSPSAADNVKTMALCDRILAAIDVHPGK